MILLLLVLVATNAKLKRRFGQTAGHDQRQVNEASGSYKVQHFKMADLSVVRRIFLKYIIITVIIWY